MPAATALSISALSRTLAAAGDDALAALLRARPDLVRPAPGDFTGLAVRLQSEASLRQVLSRLDAGTLAGLDAVVRDPTTPVPADLLEALRELGLVFPCGGSERHGTASDDACHTPPSDHTSPSDAAASLAVPGALPALLDELDVPAATLGHAPGGPAPQALEPGPMAALVRNAALSAVTELLADLEHLLELIVDSPVPTLRTGGVGMRELRRLTSARTGARRAADADVGETGWLLELAAASALIRLDADTGTWLTTETAARWRETGRHRRHQLLVSGWLLSPRSPMLLRGPHPRARIAPALTQERSRGDAPVLRRRLLQVAAELVTAAEDADGPAPMLYRLFGADNTQGAAPETEPETDPETDEAALADALTGAIADRLRWERPLAGPRVRHLLPSITLEAERLGLLALGTLTSVGRTLLSGVEDPADGVPAPPRTLHLTAMAEHLHRLLPPAAETVHVQSDLTLVPTGTPSPALTQGLTALAERETLGPVPTFRVTSASLHRALDAGWSPSEARDFLTAHSTAALPSPLTTLLDDAARSWRGVEIGAAGSWIREADPHLRAELLDSTALRHLRLRPLTDQVLISPADPQELARGLAAAGFGARRSVHSPEAADPGIRARTSGRSASDRSTGRNTAGTSDAGARQGDLLTAEAWTLTSSPWQQSPVRTLRAEPVPEDQARQAVDRLRTGTPPRPGDPTVSLGADVVGLLRTAVRERRRVAVRRVDAHGVEHHAAGVPQALQSGRLRLHAGEEELVLPVHRITGVTLPDDDAFAPVHDRPSEPASAHRPTTRPSPSRTTGRSP